MRRYVLLGFMGLLVVVLSVGCSHSRSGCCGGSCGSSLGARSNTTSPVYTAPSPTFIPPASGGAPVSPSRVPQYAPTLPPSGGFSEGSGPR